MFVFLFRYPHHDDKLLMKWVTATRRVGPRKRPWIPSKSAVLCSDHFSEDDFESHPDRRKLREGSVPSWFDFSRKVQSHTKKTTEKRPGAQLPSPLDLKRAKHLTSQHSDALPLTSKLPSESANSQCHSLSVAPQSQPVSVPDALLDHNYHAIHVKESHTTAFRQLPLAATTEPQPLAATTEPQPLATTTEPQTLAATPEPQTLAATTEAQPLPSTTEPQPLAATPVRSDHNYHVKAAKRHIASPLKRMKEKMRRLSYEKKKLMQKLKRRDKRLKCLKSTLDALQESKIVDGELIEAIRLRFENPVVAELFANEVVNRGRKSRGQRYSEEIKKLCLTFHY